MSRRDRRLRAFALVALLGAALLGGLLARTRPQDPLIATVPLGVFPGPAVLDERTGRAFIPNYLDTTVTTLGTSTGAIVRTASVGSNGGAHPGALAIDAAGGRAFVASDDGRISILDGASGAVLGASPFGGSDLALAVDERRGRLFVANVDSGTISIVDARSGAVIHTAGIQGFPQAMLVDPATGRLLLAFPAANLVEVLDGGTGGLLRAVHLGPPEPAVLFDSPRGWLALAADARGLQLRDPWTGALLVTVHGAVALGPGRLAAAALDDSTGHLFVARGLRVGMYDLGSGRLESAQTTTSPVVALVVDTPTHTCLALAEGVLAGRHLLGPGTVVAIDSRSGAVRRTVQVGLGPRYMSLDEARGRLLVVNTGLNPDDSFARLPPPAPSWVQRLPLIGGLLARSTPAQQPADGRGSLTLLDVSRLQT